jgi:hypothetical protein
MSKSIELKTFKRHGTRQRCICGGWIEKFETVVQDDGLTVCRECVRDGDIDKRLLAHADRLEAGARGLRSLVGCIRLPSPEEYIEASTLQEAEEIAFYEKISPEEAAAEAVKRGHVASLKQWFADKPGTKGGAA